MSRLNFGDDNDLQIYHDGNNSYIDDAGQGNPCIRSNQVELQKYTGETLANFTADGKLPCSGTTVRDIETNSRLVLASTGQLQTGTLDVATDAEITCWSDC